MIDPSVVGQVVDEVRMPVERGKVIELARALFDDSPVYSDPDAAAAAGFAGVPAPLTYSVVAMHWRERDDDRMVEELGLDVARVLHGQVSWTYLAPVHVGDELHGVRRVTDVASKQGSRGGAMTIVSLETEYTNQDGTVVLRQADKLIERGRDMELKPGIELAPHELGPFTEADFVRFAGASGDFNPLHFDEDFVKEAGYPGLFAMGLLPCGALVQYLAAAVGHQNVRSYGVRFTALVFVEDTLTLTGRVESVEVEDGEQRAELTLAATRQTGEVAITGSASVAVA